MSELTEFSKVTWHKANFMFARKEQTTETLKFHIICRERKLISGCLEPVVGTGINTGWGKREQTGVMEVFYILIVVMSSQMYTCKCTCECMLSCFSLVQLCDPMDCSQAGSSVHEILQAKILEWVAISFPNLTEFIEMFTKNGCLLLHVNYNLVKSIKKTERGLPGGSAGETLPANAGDRSLIPGQGRSHVPESKEACAPQLPSLCSTAREPQLLMPAHPRACAPPGKPLQWELVHRNWR